MLLHPPTTTSSLAQHYAVRGIVVSDMSLVLSFVFVMNPSSVPSPQFHHEHGEGGPQGEVGDAEGNGETQGRIVDEGDEIHL